MTSSAILSGAGEEALVKYDSVSLYFSNCPQPDALRAIDLLLAPLVPVSLRDEFLARVLAQFEQTLKAPTDATALAPWELGGLEIEASAWRPDTFEGLTDADAEFVRAVVGHGNADVSVRIRH